MADRIESAGIWRWLYETKVINVRNRVLLHVEQTKYIIILIEFKLWFNNLLHRKSITNKWKQPGVKLVLHYEEFSF